MKFNVGDKVRPTEDHGYLYIKKSDIGYVEEYDSKYNSVCVRFEKVIVFGTEELSPLSKVGEEQWVYYFMPSNTLFTSSVPPSYEGGYANSPLHEYIGEL